MVARPDGGGTASTRTLKECTKPNTRLGKVWVCGEADSGIASSVCLAVVGMAESEMDHKPDSVYRLTSTTEFRLNITTPSDANRSRFDDAVRSGEN